MNSRNPTVTAAVGIFLAMVVSVLAYALVNGYVYTQRKSTTPSSIGYSIPPTTTTIKKMGAI